MVRLSPFTGGLVTPEAAPRIVGSAYDALRADQRRALVTDGTFRGWEDPAFHVLRLRTRHGHVQTGIVGTVPVRDIGRDIRLHEHTLAARERELADRLATERIQSSPVGLIHPGASPVAGLLDEVTARPPTLDLTQGDGLHQQVWRVDGPDAMASIHRAFTAVPSLYVTDGHHRAAAAGRFADRCRARAAVAGHGRDADAGWEHLLVVVFPARQLRLHPHHRVVRDLGGRSPADVRSALAARFHVEPATAASLDPPPAGSFGVWLDGGWLQVTVPGAPTDDPVAALEVTVLQEQLLGPVLGVTDPRTDDRLAAVPGTLGLAELARRAGPDGIGFAVPAPDVSQLIAVADAGAVMPPKSTWFEPKLRSGLFLRPVMGWDGGGHVR